MPQTPRALRPPFPSTRWSQILVDPDRRDLDALARAYQRPIRAWLAARYRLADDAADDLAQEAFATMLANGLFDRADPARGRFRALLKTALSRFAIDRLRAERAEKRGGGRTPMPLDSDVDPADPRSLTPDQVLDREWRRRLLEQARDRLQDELEAAGRGTHWQVFRDSFLVDERVDSATLAARHGLKAADVSNRLQYAKRRYREVLIAIVRDTVASEDDLQEELRWLFGPASKNDASAT